MIPFRANVETREIVFIRHAESQANVDGVWNGQTDGPLSADGDATLEPLGKRLGDWEFERVVSSPLERARRTAEAFSDEYDVEPEFMEIDLGEWEGRHFSEIQAEDAEELARAIEDRTIPMGRTGESIEQASHRAIGAVDRIFHELGDGERAAVVTHGGFMQSVLHRHLAGHKRRAHAFTANTAITRIKWQFGRPRLASFNDIAHLDSRSKVVMQRIESGEPVYALIRHGQTDANVEGRWQGRGDWDLNELGRRQAEALAEWYGGWNEVYSSPLKRAASTAARVANNGFVEVPDLMELNMGEWEGMTTKEILEQWPETMETIYRHGVDLRRGGHGESWGELTRRMTNAVGAISAADGEPTVVVSHGGAIRAYLSSLTKTDDTHAQSLFTPANTSVSHVAFTDHGPEILDYSVAPHLEELQ